MDINDLFNGDFIPEEQPTITVEEYITKSKMVLERIYGEHINANKWRPITEEERNTMGCEHCNGECIITKDNIQYHCLRDDNLGDCVILDFDVNEFIEGMENIIFGEDSPFLEIIHSEIIKTNTNESEEI